MIRPGPHPPTLAAARLCRAEWRSPNFKFEEATSTSGLLAEVDGYYLRGDRTLQGQVSFGRQSRAAITNGADGRLRDATWWGMSGLVGYLLTPRWQWLTRADHLHDGRNGGGTFAVYSADDRNGLGPAPGGDPDRGANRYAITTGLKYAWNTNTILKGELRLDGADRAVFRDVGNGTYRRANMLFATSLVVFF